MSTIPPVGLPHPYRRPPGFPAVRPNTPVLPYAARSSVATFIDPSAAIVNGNHVIVGFRNLIGPFVLLDATSGFIKMGDGSDILDNAVIRTNPNMVRNPTTSIVIGSNVSIGFGAVVQGPSTISVLSNNAQPTQIGPNALIDGATIEQGVIVGALARVGPGVTVPTGFRVLPGSNVTTNAEASNPALGKVVPVTAADTAAVRAILSNNQALASGYTTLYQGNSATGVSPGVPATVTGINNGNLAAVEGASQEPGSGNGVSFEPAAASGLLTPLFRGPFGPLEPGALVNFRARVTGQAVFQRRAGLVAHHLGFRNAIRADQGQPITFVSFPSTGNGVTINSPLTTTSTAGTFGNAPLTINRSFVAGNRAVITGDQGVNSSIGTNVTVGDGAVVDSSIIGPNTTIGPRAYVSRSTLAAGSNIPAGAIIINNVRQGFIQW